MNHKLLEMLNEAGFDFTPDIMAKLTAFENLVWLEREACAKVLEKISTAPDMQAYAAAIRARGQG